MANRHPVPHLSTHSPAAHVSQGHTEAQMAREERQLGRLAGIRAAPTRLQGGDTGAASLVLPIGESPARGRSRVPSPIKRTQRACCEGPHANNHPHCPCSSPSSMPHAAPQRWGLGRENSPSRFWPDDGGAQNAKAFTDPLCEVPELTLKNETGKNLV